MDGAGSVYVIDSTNNRAVKLAGGASAPTVLPLTDLKAPDWVAVDGASGVYIPDYGNQQVVKLPSELTARSPKTAGQVQVQVGAADARYHGIHCRGQAECEPGGGAFWWRDGSRLDPHRRH